MAVVGLVLLVIGRSLGQPGSGNMPHGGMLRGAPPVPGATAYANALLNPARPVSDGTRVELWMARLVRPEMDGILERDDWAGSMELALAFMTKEEGPRGHPPRAAACLAEDGRKHRLLIAMACEDDTVEPLAARPANGAQGTEPTPGPDPWTVCDVFSIEVGPLGKDGRPSCRILVARSGEVLAEGADDLQCAVHDFGGSGWSAELSVPVSPETAETALRLAVVNASGSVAPWPPFPPDATERPVGTLALRAPGEAAPH